MAEPWLNDPVVGSPAPVSPTTADVSRETVKPWESDPVIEGGAVPQGQPEPDIPWHSFATGSGRTEFPDARELGTSGDSVSPFSKEGLRMAAAYAVSTDPKQIQDIAVKTLGAKPKQDKYGNPMVTFEGEDYYINKPGVSEADAFNFLGQAALYSPAGRFSMGAKSVFGAMGRMGVLSAATSTGADKLSEALGSDQGVDYKKAAIVGLGGALFEGLTPIAVKAWRAIFNNNRLYAQGKLTQEGAKAARAAGLDPDTMTERLAREFADEAQDAIDPKYAAGRTMGKEFDIPYTKGQATQNFSQLAKEESTRHGAFGDEAGNVMREFDQAQQLRMQGARSQVQSQLAGGERTIARPAQAGEVIKEAVRENARAAKQTVTQAYDAVEDAGEAWIGAKGVRGLWRRAAESVQDFSVDKDLMPATTKMLRNLKKLESQTRRGAKKTRVTAVALRKLETERRKLNNLVDAANSNADRAAALNVKQAYDDWVDDAFDNALLSGDSAALEAMKKARATNAEYRKLFGSAKSKDVASKFIQRLITDDTITPEQAVNVIFGRNGLGQKEASVQIVERIKAVGGDDWNVLREAAWLRLTKEAGSDGFSPRKFAKNFGKVMDDNRSLMEALFSKDELATMQRFRDDVMRTVTPDAAKNPSKTSYSVARMLREWLGRLGTMFTFSGSPVGGAVFFTMKRAPAIMGKRAARKAVRGLPPSLPRSAALPAVATGGVAASEDNMP